METNNWLSRPIIVKCRSKVLQNAPRGGILQYFQPFVIKVFVLSINYSRSKYANIECILVLTICIHE